MAQRIYLIEDDPAFRRLLEQALRRLGYEVQSFCTAEPALDALLDQPAHLVIVAAGMPGLSGAEVCLALRRHNATRHLPVLLLDHPTNAEAPDSSLPIRHLPRPFALAEFLRTVHAMVGPAPAVSAKAADFQGELGVAPLPQLLHALYSLRSTGLLHLEQGSVHKVLYLRDGYPIFARSNLVRECLGQMLVGQGRISPAECEESLCRAQASGRLQGTELLDMGLLSPQQLHQALQDQAREKILEVFTWPGGTWRFLPAKDFRKEITAIDLSPAALILQGLRRGIPAGCLDMILLQHRGRYLLPTDNPLYRFQEIDLDAGDAETWTACDGTRTLEEILAQKPFERRRREQLLGGLLLAEMLESRDLPLDVAEIPGLDPFRHAQTRQRRETFLAEYERLMPLDHCALLGVDEQTAGPAIRKAYFALVKRLHPDHYHQSGFSAELMAKVIELFQRVTDAYGVLTDPTRRREYLASRRGEAAPAVDGTDIGDILRAEEAFQKGSVLLRRKLYAEAFDILQWAWKLQPQEPEYLSAYAWALFKTHPDQAPRRFEARELLLRSADLNPRHDLTHLYLGYLLQADGQEKPAERAFEMAIQCNPNNHEALRELRLYGLRREQAAAGKGFFDRLRR